MGYFYDRAAMTVVGTPGTGVVTLGSAYYKHQTFAAAGVVDGDIVTYAIEDGAAWEVGKGTYSSSGPTLTRTTVYFSSNANTAINASSSAVVFITMQSDFEDGSALAPSIAHRSDSNTGFFFPAGDTIAASTGGVERVRINPDGTTALGATPLTNSCFRVGSNISGTLVGYGIRVDGQVQNTVTSTATGVASVMSVAGSMTLTESRNFWASQGTFTGTVTNQYGFYVGSTLTGATNNYGFYANISSAAGRYNFYSAGTADNLFYANVLVFGTGGIGYTTGSGGVVTQATSRTTGVTLNKTNGAITLVSAAGSASYQSFTVTNSTVAATDTINLSQQSGTDKYILHVTNVAAGSFQITFATTGGTTTEQPVINFAVLKAVTA